MLSLKSTPLTGDFAWYYAKDPAFRHDDEAFNYDAWRDTGNEAHLPTKPGEKPTKFTLRRLTASISAFISDRSMEDGGGTVQAAVWAVQLLLRKVEHFDTGLPEWRLVNKYGHEAVSDEWMRVLQLVDDGELFRALIDRVTEEMIGSPRC